MKLSYDNYLVTGGAGFIGSHLGEAIVKQGKKLVILDNLITGKRENLEPWWDEQLCTFVEADISDYNSIHPYFDSVDIVFHNAASKCTVCRKAPNTDLMVNAWGSLNVFRASQSAGVKKVIHASTGSTMEGNPKSFYGVSKLAAENYLAVMREYHPEFVYSILRYYHVYGTRQDNSDEGGVIPIFIRNVLNNEPIVIFGDGKQVRHFTTVEDVVKANLYVSEVDEFSWYPESPLTVVSDVKISILDLAHLICELMGKPDHEIIFRPEKHGDVKNFEFVRSYNLDELVRFNNDLEGELKKVINWYREKYKSRR